MVLTTRVASAKAGTKSMKSTIPEGIVEFLQLDDKDELEWEMDIQGEERRAIVTKKKAGTAGARFVRPERMRNIE